MPVVQQISIFKLLLLFEIQEETLNIKRWIVKAMRMDPKQFFFAAQSGRRPPYICEYLRPRLHMAHLPWGKRNHYFYLKTNIKMLLTRMPNLCQLIKITNFICFVKTCPNPPFWRTLRDYSPPWGYHSLVADISNNWPSGREQSLEHHEVLTILRPFRGHSFWILK